ncbi:MAG TPA: hypothetical protein VEW69_04795 [Alphaproteobacteria bacterium]|nr:hypothetical protein [Alphaproteobacteria bacterium]
MLCPQCGKESLIVAEQCRFCGASLHISATATSRRAVATVAAASPASQTSAIAPDMSGRKGVGGWLLVFCAGLITASLFYLGFIVMAAFRDFSGENLLLDALALVYSVSGVAVGVLVWLASKSALRMIRVYFVIACIANVVPIVLLFVKLASGKFDAPIGFALRIVALFLLACWMGYFHTSARVKATFGANL